MTSQPAIARSRAAANQQTVQICTAARDDPQQTCAHSCIVAVQNWQLFIDKAVPLKLTNISRAVPRNLDSDLAHGSGMLTLDHAAGTHAEDTMIELSLSDPSRWDYFSDQVMGGVSEGRTAFEQIGDQPILRLTGMVSTANRGGFIQARIKLDAPLPETARGVILNVRGNDETYFVHLRTTRTILPWQFYQASFQVSESWQEVRIPFIEFAPYGRLLRKSFDVRSVRSLAVAAFGRDHNANLFVRAVGFY